MEVIRIVMIGITGMLLGLLLKGTRPEYTVYLSPSRCLYFFI